jgi:hypothetical protein
MQTKLDTHDDEILVTDEQLPVKAAVLDVPHDVAFHPPYSVYLLLPVIFLTATLLGGMRLSGEDSSFIFLKPPLFCLIFASMTMVLFFRSGVLAFEGWLSESFSGLKNLANAAVLLTLFAACTQIYNSLIPEQGLAFWVTGFCVFWALWINLFADFDKRRLFRSLGAALGLIFVVKYLVLANLTTTGKASWLQRIMENPSREAFTWLLDLPRFSPGTGYLQFFAVILFLIGLFLLPRTSPGVNARR